MLEKQSAYSPNNLGLLGVDSDSDSDSVSVSERVSEGNMVSFGEKLIDISAKQNDSYENLKY